MLVRRYDLAKFSPKVTRTPQGFIRAPANFTRVGVFVYRRADGTEVRELRPEEEVFHEDSLSTLRGAPVVELHPQEGMVTPANAKKLSIGWGGETVTRKDTLASGIVTVFDETAISKVASRELSEISMGYQCTIDPTPGHHPVHGRYDQIQRGIRYNHIALGPKDWGRAGGEVSLRLDSDDAVLAKVAESGISLDTDDAARADGVTAPKDPTMKIKIAGVEYEVSDQVGQAYTAYEKRNDELAAELRTAQEALQGRFDAQAQELKTTKEQLVEAKDPERFDSAVRARIELERKARKVLGEDAELPASTREIQEAVLKHDNADLDLSQKSDEYVAARFDHAIENPPAAPKPGKARKDALDAAGQTAVPKAEEARQRMREDAANAWQQPLAVSTRK